VSDIPCLRGDVAFALLLRGQLSIGGKWRNLRGSVAVQVRSRQSDAVETRFGVGCACGSNVVGKQSVQKCSLANSVAYANGDTVLLKILPPVQQSGSSPAPHLLRINAGVLLEQLLPCGKRIGVMRTGCGGVDTLESLACREVLAAMTQIPLKCLITEYRFHGRKTGAAAECIKPSAVALALGSRLATRSISQAECALLAVFGRRGVVPASVHTELARA